jgi:hypothetical protein
MYEECLYVFDSITCDTRLMDEKRSSFDEKYTTLSEQFENWKNTMKSEYGSSKSHNAFSASKFSESLEAFMNHLQFLYASLSDKGNADIHYKPHFQFDQQKTIYSKFYLMMMDSPWRQIHNNPEYETEWKKHMIWMGKRLFYIAYYNNKQHNWQQYIHVRDFIHHYTVMENQSSEDLWNDGAPTWFIVTRKKPGNKRPGDSGLNSLLQSLNEFSRVQ